MIDEAAFSDERVRELAEELLAGPRYAAYRRPKTTLQEWIDGLAETLRSLGDRVPDWVAELWAWIKSSLSHSLEALFADEPLAILVRFVLAGAVLATSAWMIASVVRTLREGAGEEEDALTAPLQPGESSWRERAESLAGEGRYLEAAHCTQLAALQLLLQGEWLALERSDPNRTLRQRLREASLPDAERGEFLSLLDRLEYRWFRDRAEDRELYGAWRVLHARLEGFEASP